MLPQNQKSQEEAQAEQDDKQKQQEQQNQIVQSQIQGKELLVVKKPGYFSDIDRATAIQNYTKTIQSRGFLGFGQVDMESLKANLKTRKENTDRINFEREDEKTIKQSSANYNELKKYDGVTIERDLNVFERTDRDRLEQRLLWDQNGDPYFKQNGELITDDDFYDKKISKVLTVTFEANPACQVYRRNAIMCERLNQNKHVGFKLNIYIGKVTLYKHPEQDEEEKLMTQLREDMREYRKRVELALIPHCNRIEKLIDKEHSELIKKADKPEKEIQILLNERKRITEIKQEEVEHMTDLMTKISGKWREIEDRRTDAKGKRNFLSTQYQLNVKKYNTDDTTKEVELGLGKIIDQEKLKDVTNFPTEMSRRDRIKKNKFFVKLLINNKVVAETQPGNLDWPSFESTFMEKFQILLYSKPSSIKLQVYKDKFPLNQLIDTVELEIPGEKMKTKTSSNRLLKEVEFSQGMAERYLQRMKDREKEAQREEEEKQKKQALLQKQKEQEQKEKEKQQKEEEKKKQEEKKGEDGADDDNNNKEKADNNALGGDDDEDGDEEKQRLEELEAEKNERERQQREKEEEEQRKKEKEEMEKIQEIKAKKAAQFEGKVSFMAEWEGNGPSMPPQNMENFGQGKLVYDDDLTRDNEEEALIKRQLNMGQEGFHFDVNDPRNKEQLEILQSLKNVEEEEGVKKDIMMPFYDKSSLRQELIKLRQVNPDINGIPVDELGCCSDTELMNQLKESKLVQDEIQELKKKEIENRVQKKVMTIEKNFIAAEDVCTDNLTTKQRVAEIIKTLKNRQREQKKKKGKNSVAAGQITLRNIIKEFRFEEKQFFLMDIIKSLCTQKRKLAPPKIKTNKVQLSEVCQIKIQLYISHGRNIPVRHEDQQDRNNMSNIRAYPQNFSAAPNHIASHVSQYPPRQQFGGTGQNWGGPQYGGQSQFNTGQFSNRGGPSPFDMQNTNRQQPLLQQKKPSVYSYIDVKLRCPDYMKGDKNYDLSFCRSKSKYYSGSNPDWNSEAEVTFKSNKLMQKRNGQETTDPKSHAFDIYEITNPQNQLYITLFEHKDKIMKDHTNKNQVIVHVDNYFLGNMVIPLSQLIKNPQQSATFRIQRPLVLYGYNLDMNLPYGQQNDKQVKFVSPITPTTVTMSLTTEPQLDIPDEQDLEYFGTQENSDLLYHAKIYLEKLKKDRIKSKRHIRLWAQDLKNNSYYLPKFINPDGLNPPIEIKDSSAIERAARYVALIPFKLENDNFKDVPDSFMDCQQFLDIKGGDFEEHACLLCNYFIYIDKALGGNHAYYKSYVVLGKAVPEGDTFYVVRLSTREEDQGCVEIWNPQTGDPYVMKNEKFVSPALCCIPVGGGKQTIIEENDKACPLQDIGCIFDNTGVYINSQKNGAPEQVDWNIENPKLWERYPDKNKLENLYGKSIQTLQNSKLEYDNTDDEKVNKLQLSIQSYIHTQIEEMRSEAKQGIKFQSKFLEHISLKIRDTVVQSLENIRYTSRLSGLSSTLSVSKQEQEKAAADLEKICKHLDEQADRQSRKLYGFPLNFTFTDYEKIWQEIEATGIAEILRNDFDFVLSVYCAKYPSYIISVWVFIGVLFDEDD